MDIHLDGPLSLYTCYQFGFSNEQNWKMNNSNIQMIRCCSCEIKIALKTSSGFILIVSCFLPLGWKDKARDRRGQQSVPPSGIYMHSSALRCVIFNGLANPWEWSKIWFLIFCVFKATIKSAFLKYLKYMCMPPVGTRLFIYCFTPR